MKIKKYLKDKYSRNKILFFLLIALIPALIVGFYYNSVRDSKTITHFGVKNSPNKESEIFFQRSSDVNEDKKSLKDIFNYKFGTTVNLYGSSAYFIFNERIYQLDFNLQESKIIFEKNDFVIDDVYLFNNNIYILGNSSLSYLNMNNLEFKELAAGIVENEILNIKNNKVVLGYDKCKFEKDKCTNEINNLFTIFDLTTNETSRITTDNENDLISSDSFFGTNKVKRQGEFLKYPKDEGNKNYNLRIFTQF